MKIFTPVFLLYAAGSMPIPAQEPFDLAAVNKVCVGHKGAQSVLLRPQGLEHMSDARAKSDTDFLSQFGPQTLDRFQLFQYAGCPGQYKAAGLDPLRNSLTKAKWTRLATSGNDSSEVYLLQLAGGRIGGIAVISAEPAKVWAAVILGDFTADALTMPDVSTRTIYGGALIPDVSTKITYGDPVDAASRRDKPDQ